MVDLKKPLVFVVEDNIAYRVLLGRILQKKGYMVLLYEDGKKALDMLRYVRPSLILSDIQMPEMDGFEFYKKVTRQFSKNPIPFIYLSSTSLKNEIKKATKLGATDMLGKPVKPDELAESIESVLGKITHSG